MDEIKKTLDELALDARNDRMYADQKRRARKETAIVQFTEAIAQSTGMTTEAQWDTVAGFLRQFVDTLEGTR